MSKGLVIYNNADSSIWGYIRLGKDSDTSLYPLLPNQTALEIPLTHPAYKNQAQWKIANGQLFQKNIVTASASASTFPADGTSTVTLTFSNLSQAASVNVGGQSVTVSPSDNVLTLTSDAPRTFQVQINDGAQWSNPVAVEAI